MIVNELQVNTTVEIALDDCFEGEPVKYSDDVEEIAYLDEKSHCMT